MERAIRDHGLQIDEERVREASQYLKNSVELVRGCVSKDQLRGYEGEAASVYSVSYTHLDVYKRQIIGISERYMNG